MNNLTELASELAARLQEDIILAKTREEHIRLTARANEAAHLAAEAAR
jgi:hypothetical protein